MYYVYVPGLDLHFLVMLLNLMASKQLRLGDEWMYIISLNETYSLYGGFLNMMVPPNHPF